MGDETAYFNFRFIILNFSNNDENDKKSYVREKFVSPGCLKCECESSDDFPTLTVVREFAVYPMKRTK
jgi:hypothetical protein